MLPISSRKWTCVVVRFTVVILCAVVMNLASAEVSSARTSRAVKAPGDGDGVGGIQSPTSEAMVSSGRMFATYRVDRTEREARMVWIRLVWEQLLTIHFSK